MATTPNVSEVTPENLLNEIKKETTTITPEVKDIPPVEELPKEEPEVEEKKTFIPPKSIPTNKSTSVPTAKVVPSTTTKSTKSVVEESIGVRIIKERIDKYINYSNAPGIKKSSEIVEYFQNIIQAAIHQQQDRAVLDTIFEFFKKNRKRILHPDVALKGIQLLPQSRREKIQIAYMLLWDVSSPTTTVSLNFEKATRILGNSGLVQYLQEKIKR